MVITDSHEERVGKYHAGKDPEKIDISQTNGNRTNQSENEDSAPGWIFPDPMNENQEERDQVEIRKGRTIVKKANREGKTDIS